MPLGRFILLTVLGSGIWVSVLAVLGYLFGANHELLQAYYNEISWGMVIIGAIAAAVVISRRKRNRL
jgi:membrane protein DedA with SNARE-associated domain